MKFRRSASLCGATALALLAGCSGDFGDNIDGIGAGAGGGVSVGGTSAAGAAGSTSTGGAGTVGGSAQGGAPGTSAGAAGAAPTTGGSAGSSAGGAGGVAMGGTAGRGPGGSGGGGRGNAGASGSPGVAGSPSGGSPGVPPGGYCAATANWNAAYTTLEDQILVIVNQRRAAGATCGGQAMPPVGPLTMNAELRCAARVHSKDMADRDFFAHDNPEGDGPGDRMTDAGYDGGGGGENIAAGNDTAAETMTQWMNSDGHCRNIMNGNYTEIGVGYHPGGRYGHVWTQTFGRP